MLLEDTTVASDLTLTSTHTRALPCDKAKTPAKLRRAAIPYSELPPLHFPILLVQRMRRRILVQKTGPAIDLTGLWRGCTHARLDDT